MPEISSKLNPNSKTNKRGQPIGEDRTAAGFLRPCITTKDEVLRLHYEVNQRMNGYLGQAKFKKDPSFGGSTSALLTSHGFIDKHNNPKVLIGTSNLGDSSNYLYLMDKNDKPIVIRLNQKIYKPTDLEELKRIHATGSFVENKRLYRNLAMSRSLADYKYDTQARVDGKPGNTKGSLSREVEPAVYDLNELLKAYGIKTSNIKSLFLMSCCDGIVDIAQSYHEMCTKKHNSLDAYQSMKDAPSKKRAKYGDETYLADFAKWAESKENKPLSDFDAALFSDCLLAFATRHGSQDNLSVIAAKINLNSLQDENFYLWEFDGHSGSGCAEAAHQYAHAALSHAIQQNPRAYPGVHSIGNDQGFNIKGIAASFIEQQKKMNGQLKEDNDSDDLDELDDLNLTLEYMFELQKKVKHYFIHEEPSQENLKKLMASIESFSDNPELAIELESMFISLSMQVVNDPIKVEHLIEVELQLLTNYEHSVQKQIQYEQYIEERRKEHVTERKQDVLTPKFLGNQIIRSILQEPIDYIKLTLLHEDAKKFEDAKALQSQLELRKSSIMGKLQSSPRLASYFDDLQQDVNNSVHAGNDKQDMIDSESPRSNGIK